MSKGHESMFAHGLIRSIGIIVCACMMGPVADFAADLDPVPNTANDASATTLEEFSLHGQFTLVEQYHPSFTAPYSGTNSLYPGNSGKETADATLFAGVRLWRGWEFYFNPEVDQGFGLSDTLGVAGFPSGEAYKVGSSSPYVRIPRMFFRKVVDLGGETEVVDDKANQLAGAHTHDNLALTVGKFSVVDIFDTNTYAHDPRADLLNWSIIDAGAFDYAADAWGYTYGAAAEWTTGRWTFRGGAFDLSSVPNAKTVERNFGEFELVSEIEERHELGGHAGKLKVLGFVNRGRMASYDDAVRLAQAIGGTPDVAQVRRFASRPGFEINGEQEIADDVGVFARASANDGSKEAYEFTEINRSVSGGISIKGGRWGRSEDVASFAVVNNMLSNSARRYFAAGGLGILIGDGQLPNTGPEQIAETSYSIPIVEHLTFTLDYQFISNPAYNRDRGPVSVFGGRVHAEF
jgi:high affinity Mn2+ porin